MIDGGAYAFLESLETYAGEIHARFDVIPKSIGDQISERRGDLGNLLNEVPSYFIHTSAPANESDIIGENWSRGLYENRWYQFEVGRGGIGAEQYENGLERQEVAISPPELVDGRTKIGRALHKAFSLGSVGDASMEDISEALSIRQSREKANLPAFFAVYDVGQGNCNAICSADGVPIVYFDLGGGMGRNARTYLKRKRFCFTKAPPVILSHWDQDHWFSGLHAPQGHPARNALDSKWIVPRQKIGPSATKLATLLHAKGNLLIWPQSRRRLLTQFGEIRRCGGKATSKNDSGLALIAKIGAYTVLAPGDANYRHIPTPISPVDFLVASHHGGSLRCATLPQPSGSKHCKIVFSFGRGNYEGHPNCQMVRRYTGAGWTERRATPKGNVGLGSVSPVQFNCAGKHCDLRLKQI